MTLFARSLQYERILKFSSRSVSQFRSFNDNGQNKNYNNANNKRKFIILGGAISTLLVYEINKRFKNQVFLAEKEAGVYIKGLPEYKQSEVAKHGDAKAGIWVTYKDGVYDITDFISKHPGGDQIMLAAGNSVEPFWMMYGVHKKPEILAMLESYRIGNLSPEDRVREEIDLYRNEPKRSALLKPASVKPFNAEPPAEVLVEKSITPNDLYFVRNHLPVPEVDINQYELEVEVEGKKKIITLKYDDLKKMPKHTVTATTMCAGNRRSEMVEIKPVKGLNWGTTAIGNAVWTGVRLSDVLKLHGIDGKSNYEHVQFEGLDCDPTGKPFGASIPLWKAISEQGDVILAYEMNGEPIPRDHGYPIRAIVPGYVGVRNVKWLSKIIVSKNESDSHWQQNDYKGFSPSVDWDTVDFTKSPAIQELPVTSAICKPVPGSTVKVEKGFITVQGYAWSGGGQKIVRVDVTADQGQTWLPATFDYQDANKPPQHWAWTLWTIKIPVPPKTNNVEIWAKAVDSCYNTQPEDFKNIWNLRGVLSNAYHRVKVNLKQ